MTENADDKTTITEKTTSNSKTIDSRFVAIAGIIVLEIAMGIINYLQGTDIDVGTIGTGIAAIAGLAGFDIKS
jgi:hypothetical protein